MNAAETDRLIAVIRWLVTGRNDLRGMAVCGSWARGNPRPDSDLDVLIVAQNPDSLRRDQKWIRDLNFSDVGFRYVGHKTARYGVVWSAHIELEPEAKLELTFAKESWASVHPIDQGTRDVVMDIARVSASSSGALYPNRMA
jgi:predicted nucleotidyltransferase